MQLSLSIALPCFDDGDQSSHAKTGGRTWHRLWTDQIEDEAAEQRVDI